MDNKSPFCWILIRDLGVITILCLSMQNTAWNAVATKTLTSFHTYKALKIQHNRGLSMCKNDGTPAAMESGKGDTTMATFVRHIFRGGNEVGDTSQKYYATSGQGPHALNHPDMSAWTAIRSWRGLTRKKTSAQRDDSLGGVPAFKADVGHCTGTTLRAINRRCSILQVWDRHSHAVLWLLWL